MQHPFYEFSILDNAHRFEFESIGPRKIRKLVYFDKTDIPNFYNLSLGDQLSNGKVSFITVSNNNDRDKVIATTIQILLHFLAIYPDAYVLFSGNTAERTRLYKIIIARELATNQTNLSFWGMDEEGNIQPFDKNKSYIGFILSFNKKLPNL
ncbi:MAG TPA: hypothetical protein DCR35_19710 [Runella sp.]|nr:hypothetical protein [Runella sp.]HAO51336.1 hypothetical protein [Runella sp.]